MKMAMVAIFFLFLTLFSNSKADQDFNVRSHLSTVTRYRSPFNRNSLSLFSYFFIILYIKYIFGADMVQ